LTIRLLLVVLEQPDAVVVRRYGRVVPRPNSRRLGATDTATAVVRRRPLPLVLLIVVLVLLLLLLL